MFYKFLKVLVRLTLKIFFKKIFISGLDHIKDQTPQLVASNHPNGFLEPLLMACFFPKDLHFLVRGDVFENPFLRPILKSTHQIPIFRFRDGFSKLRENSHTIDESLQVLIENKNLLIFAEGSTESVKKLRPLQKGIVRIAFQALEKNPELELEILPVGLNFTYPTDFNEEVMLQVGQPILVQKYFESYKTDKNKAHEWLLNDLYDAMKMNVVHLDDAHRSAIFEKLVLIERSKHKKPYLPIHVYDTYRLSIEQEIAAKTNNLNDEQATVVRHHLDEMDTNLRKIKLNWHDLVKKPLDPLKLLILIIGFLPAFIGSVLHSIPLAGGYYFTKGKVKQKEFKASILMVSTLLLMLIWYITLLAIILIAGWSWYVLILFLFSGLYLRWYYYMWHNTAFALPSKYNSVQQQGLEILKHLK